MAATSRLRPSSAASRGSATSRPTKTPATRSCLRSAVDLFIKGRGLDFSFERRYSSHRSDVDGPLGFGWDHVYNSRVSVDQGGAKVTLSNGNGRADEYTTTLPSTSYESPAGVYTLFTYPAPSTHVLRNREGVRTTFLEGRLSSIQDPEGNALRFFYDAAGHLDYVLDTVGLAESPTALTR